MGTVYISNDINCPCNIKKCTSETIESCCGCPEWFEWKAEKTDMDTEKIVRCKDCEHWETSWIPQGVSDGRHYCAPLDLYPSADWFCADGKKRRETKQLSDVPVVIDAESVDKSIKRLRIGLPCYGEKCLSCPHRKHCVTHYEHEAADIIETLYTAYTESFSVIAKAFRNNPKDLVLREYMMKNACCCDTEEEE